MNKFGFKSLLKADRAITSNALRPKVMIGFSGQKKADRDYAAYQIEKSQEIRKRSGDWRHG